MDSQFLLWFPPKQFFHKSSLVSPCEHTGCKDVALAKSVGGDDSDSLLFASWFVAHYNQGSRPLE